MTVVVRDDVDVLDAHLAFHLNAGIDLVLATDYASRDGSSEVLESYARDGHLVRIPETGEDRDHDWRTAMARRAVAEHQAEWIVDAEADEFWLPRAETLKDVLQAIPPRYGVVQALTRVFLPRPDDGRSFAQRMTVRSTAYSPAEESAGRLDWALRHVYRGSPDVVVGPRDFALDGRVPLRAWYPIEVLRFPLRDREQAQRRAGGRSGPPSPRSRVERDFLGRGGDPAERWEAVVVSDDELSRGVADGSLVLDERLKDALARLEDAAGAEGSTRRSALPVDGDGRHLSLPVPNVVDDVEYAGECAAVREVDFEPLVARIGELEERIRVLESRLWPRVRRRLYGLLRRPVA